MRLTYLAVANAFAALRLPPMSDRDKDAEILALRHQLVVLQRQLGPARVGRRKVGADPPDEIGRQPGQGLFAGQHDAERGDSGRVQPGDHCHQYDGGPRSFSMYSRRLSGDSAN